MPSHKLGIKNREKYEDTEAEMVPKGGMIFGGRIRNENKIVLF